MLRQAFLSLLRREHRLELSDRLANLGLVTGVVEERAAENAPAVFEYGYCEVAVLVATFGSATEGGLKSEAIDEVELAPHNDTSSALASLLHDEIAAVKTEII